MPEIVATVTNAISIAKKLREVSEKLKNAEMRNLIGDLSLELAEIKMQLAEMMQENTELKGKLRELETGAGEPCPRCRKRAWRVASTKPHPVMGDLGATIRTYKCDECGLTEDAVITPGSEAR